MSNHTGTLDQERYIVKVLQRILAPGQLTEIRAFDASYSDDRYLTSFMGYFDYEHISDLAREVIRIRHYSGIYFIPNPVKHEMYARAHNRIRKSKKGESTKDVEMEQRLWLLIDCDPVRPEGISSTDTEHEAALAKCREIRDWLTSKGWSLPVFADSGNGGHLMYRVDLPCEDGELIKRVINELSDRFSDSAVTVDRTVINPARIWKLYGTQARKGDNVEGRPWRNARIIECPSELSIVTEEMLQALAPVKEVKRRVTNTTNTCSSYVEAALKGEADKVSSAPVGTRNNALNAAAFALGTLVGAGALGEEQAKVELTSAALAAGLGEKETERTIESGLSAGKRQPRQMPEASASTPASKESIEALCDRIRKAVLDDPKKGLLPILTDEQTLNALADLYSGSHKNIWSALKVELMAIRGARAGVEEFEKAIKAVVLSRRRRPQRRETSRPLINVYGRQLVEILGDAYGLIGQVNEHRIQEATQGLCEREAAPLFLRGGQLVHLEHSPREPPCFREMSVVSAYGMLFREADWVSITEEEFRADRPPREIAADLIAYPPDLIPRVEAVISTPIFGRNGQLITERGLHMNDYLWMEFNALSVGPIPEHPSREEIAAAKALILDDLFVDFPFVEQSDKAHAVAALLLPCARRMVVGPTPIHIIEAPLPGSGKNFLANLISIITMGCECDSRTMPTDEDEIRKMITAELMMSRPIILLDNAKERWTIDSPSLASVLTATSWTDRILGVSSMATLSNMATWILTGNNPKLSAEIARRAVRIRIDPKIDRPWERKDFKHPMILNWAKEHRAELVRSALTLVQAWIAEGQPKGKQVLGSFESWAAIMGGILDVVEVDGFLEGQEKMYAAADAESQPWREFVVAWSNIHQENKVYTDQLVSLCLEHKLMLDVLGDNNIRSQQSRMGKALHGARGRTYGKLQIIVHDPDNHGKTMYSLKQT